MKKKLNMHIEMETKSPPKKNISFDCFSAFSSSYLATAATLVHSFIYLLTFLFTKKMLSLSLSFIKLASNAIFLFAHERETPGIFHTFTTTTTTTTT